MTADDVEVTAGSMCHGCGYTFHPVGEAFHYPGRHTVHECLAHLRARVEALEEAARTAPVTPTAPAGPQRSGGLERGDEIAKVRTATGCGYQTARQSLRRTGWDVDGAIARVAFLRAPDRLTSRRTK